MAGLIASGRAGVAAIGRSLPGSAYGKHTIKRVDRFLGNERADLAVLSRLLLACAACRGGRLLLELKAPLPEGTQVVIVADRGFGRARLMQRCRGLGLSFVLKGGRCSSTGDAGRR